MDLVQEQREGRRGGGGTGGGKKRKENVLISQRMLGLVHSCDPAFFLPVVLVSCLGFVLFCIVRN